MQGQDQALQNPHQGFVQRLTIQTGDHHWRIILDRDSNLLKPETDRLSARNMLAYRPG
jgi:hypothetical protein